MLKRRQIYLIDHKKDKITAIHIALNNNLRHTTTAPKVESSALKRHLSYKNALKMPNFIEICYQTYQILWSSGQKYVLFDSNFEL